MRVHNTGFPNNALNATLIGTSFEYNDIPVLYNFVSGLVRPELDQPYGLQVPNVEVKVLGIRNKVKYRLFFSLKTNGCMPVTLYSIVVFFKCNGT